MVRKNTTTSTTSAPWVTSPATVAGKSFWVDWPLNLRVGHSDLISKLQLANLDPKLARLMCNSHAFRRAIREVVGDRLKDVIGETVDAITFQISSRIPKADEVQYIKDAVVSCDKATGQITCLCPATQKLAEAAFNKAMGERNTSDCTRLIKRIFHDRLTVDIFRQKGAYFALPSAFALVDQVELFVTILGGTLTSWEAAPSPANSVKVQTVVVSEFDAAIGDAETHIEKITSETGNAVLSRAGSKLAEIEENLKHHARRIGDKLAVLEDYLALCRKKLADNQSRPPMSAPFRPEDSGRDEPEESPAGDEDGVEVVTGKNTERPPSSSWAAALC